MFHAIPVEFGPHEADWWMVWVTAASAFTSLLVAGVAVWSAIQARKAAKDATDIATASADLSAKSVKIAEEASEREDARIETEELRLAHEAKTRISLAMARALNAEDVAVISRGHAERRQEARSLSDSLFIEALALIDLDFQGAEDLKLRSWFVEARRYLSAQTRPQSPSGKAIREHLEECLKKIALWNRNVLTTAELSTDLHQP